VGENNAKTSELIKELLDKKFKEADETQQQVKEGERELGPGFLERYMKKTNSKTTASSTTNSTKKKKRRASEKSNKDDSNKQTKKKKKKS